MPIGHKAQSNIYTSPTTKSDKIFLCMPLMIQHVDGAIIRSVVRLRYYYHCLHDFIASYLLILNH